MLKIWGRKNSANVQKVMWGIGELELAGFLGQHDRNAVADRIGELGRARDQLLLGGVVFERALGHGADQDFKQLGIDAAGGTIG